MELKFNVIMGSWDNGIKAVGHKGQVLSRSARGRVVLVGLSKFLTLVPHGSCLPLTRTHSPASLPCASARLRLRLPFGDAREALPASTAQDTSPGEGCGGGGKHASDGGQSAAAGSGGPVSATANGGLASRALSGSEASRRPANQAPAGSSLPSPQRHSYHSSGAFDEWLHQSASAAVAASRVLASPRVRATTGGGGSTGGGAPASQAHAAAASAAAAGSGRTPAEATSITGRQHVSTTPAQAPTRVAAWGPENLVHASVRSGANSGGGFQGSAAAGVRSAAGDWVHQQCQQQQQQQQPGALLTASAPRDPTAPSRSAARHGSPATGAPHQAPHTATKLSLMPQPLSRHRNLSMYELQAADRGDGVTNDGASSIPTSINGPFQPWTQPALRLAPRHSPTRPQPKDSPPSPSFRPTPQPPLRVVRSHGEAVPPDHTYPSLRPLPQGQGSASPPAVPDYRLRTSPRHMGSGEYGQQMSPGSPDARPWSPGRSPRSPPSGQRGGWPDPVHTYNLARRMRSSPRALRAAAEEAAAQAMGERAYRPEQAAAGGGLFIPQLLLGRQPQQGEHGRAGEAFDSPPAASGPAAQRGVKFDFGDLIGEARAPGAEALPWEGSTAEEDGWQDEGAPAYVGGHSTRSFPSTPACNRASPQGQRFPTRAHGAQHTGSAPGSPPMTLRFASPPACPQQVALGAAAAARSGLWRPPALRSPVLLAPPPRERTSERRNRHQLRTSADGVAVGQGLLPARSEPPTPASTRGRARSASPLRRGSASSKLGSLHNRSSRGGTSILTPSSPVPSAVALTEMAKRKLAASRSTTPEGSRHATTGGASGSRKGSEQQPQEQQQLHAERWGGGSRQQSNPGAASQSPLTTENVQAGVGTGSRAAMSGDHAGHSSNTGQGRGTSAGGAQSSHQQLPAEQQPSEQQTANHRSASGGDAEGSVDLSPKGIASRRAVLAQDTPKLLRIAPVRGSSGGPPGPSQPNAVLARNSSSTDPSGRSVPVPPVAPLRSGSAQRDQVNAHGVADGYRGPMDFKTASHVGTGGSDAEALLRSCGSGLREGAGGNTAARGKAFGELGGLVPEALWGASVDYADAEGVIAEFERRLQVRRWGAMASPTACVYVHLYLRQRLA